MPIALYAGGGYREQKEHTELLEKKKREKKVEMKK